ncbi:YbhB/YbcL family Raf kinase inhibitor-like protein [Demequina sp.]|uniref:YbhB/YbcL family Raf kinase inhibitor-like protein n=1 Tax=Demequina sp. TaxID=2050685 RepID=UPI0025C3EA6C|nr:YbhB/YbcL family Raf kinase inhibitor-like protein [Demequina sp.]
MIRRATATALVALLCAGCASPDEVSATDAVLTVTSEDFADGAAMPEWTTADAFGGQCTGDNTNPQLSWQSPSPDTEGFAITMIDTDAGGFVHWLVADIPASTTSIDRGASGDLSGVGGSRSMSSTSYGEYFGPCPPNADHHYEFSIYALDRALALEPGFTHGDLLTAMEGHILAQGSITGLQSGPA